MTDLNMIRRAQIEAAERVVVASLPPELRAEAPSTDLTDLERLAREAVAFKTPRIERAIAELGVSFVTVDVCGADANAVALYVRKLEAALRSALAALASDSGEGRDG